MLFLCDANHAPKICTKSASLALVAVIVAKTGSALFPESKKWTNTTMHSFQETIHTPMKRRRHCNQDPIASRHADKLSYWYMRCPRIGTSEKGFGTICKDQKELNSRGLLLFIRNDLTFEKLQSAERADLEIQMIRIRTSKTQWLHLHMFTFQTETLKLLDSMHLWLPPHQTLSRGKELEEWICDLNLHVLNDGSTIRTSRITRNDSSPDLFISGKTWSMKISWKTVIPIGDFNHLPIQIDIHRYSSFCTLPTSPPQQAKMMKEWSWLGEL